MIDREGLDGVSAMIFSGNSKAPGPDLNQHNPSQWEQDQLKESLVDWLQP